MFVGAGVGLLGRSGVGDGGVGSRLLPLSSVDNSWTTGVDMGGSHTGRHLVSSPAGSWLGGASECYVPY